MRLKSILSLLLNTPPISLSKETKKEKNFEAKKVASVTELNKKIPLFLLGYFPDNLKSVPDIFFRKKIPYNFLNRIGFL